MSDVSWTLADIGDLLADVRRRRGDAIAAALLLARTPTRTPADRYAAYWRARLLIAEERAEPLYVTAAERDELRATYPLAPAEPVGERVRFEVVPAGSLAATFYGRPVVVDDERSVPARERAGEAPGAKVEWQDLPSGWRLAVDPDGDQWATYPDGCPACLDPEPHVHQVTAEGRLGIVTLPMALVDPNHTAGAP